MSLEDHKHTADFAGGRNVNPPPVLQPPVQEGAQLEGGVVRDATNVPETGGNINYTGPIQAAGGNENPTEEGALERAYGPGQDTQVAAESSSEEDLFASSEGE